MADGGFARIAAALVSEAGVYARGSVALLAPRPGVLVEPTLDNAAVLVHRRRAWAFDGHLRREVVEGEAFVYGVAADAGDPAYGGDALAALSQLPYSYDLGHADHFPFWPP